ncbi:AMP-dependent synthetase/ligase [Penicillium italicum]|uniref:AMP-dependent synthetase/ligase n=1 Tax=Penicillium italicum TaxID=40296 RepID=A0A0A2KBE4_PENIT|nr:AMP-dependent synthetase/ligase [Penicillium italicum]
MAVTGSHTTSTEDILNRREQFWRHEFKDLSATTFPVVSSLYKQSTLTIITENIDLACGELDPVSAGAVLALAWGLVLSRYTGNDDVVFGLSLQSESDDFSNMPTLPLRLLVDPQQSAIEALNTTETKIMDRSTFGVSSTGELSDFGGDIAAGCQFMNILNIRQGQQKHPSASQSIEARKVPLVINCEIRTNGVDVEALVDPSAISVETTRMMLHQLGHSFRTALNRCSQDTLVGDLRSVCPQGLADLMERGVQPPPPSVRARVHDLIVAQCQSRPSEPAIAAWDGQLTYHELDQFSSRLATRLPKLQVIRTNGVDVEALVDPSAISVETTRMMLHQLGHSFRTALNRCSQDTLVGDLRSVCPQGLADLMERGVQPPPPSVRARVHDLIVAQCQSRPSEPAIAAWDGQLTYHELDQFSSRLATRLAKLQVVQPDKIVPVLMERSVWVSVAILGILKAGGAFLLMDTSFSDDYVKQIWTKIEAPLVLTSGCQEDRARSLGSPVLVVGDNPLSADEEEKDTNLQSVYVQPSDACHGLFTSGSSGDPKVVVIDHAAVCTAWAQPTATQLTLSSSSRVLQFASHAFGACVAEYLGAMIHGACLCIAPEFGPGSDAVEAIQRLNANFITLTPSASRLLDPNQVPSLQVVVLAGEALGPLDLDKWQGRVQLKCMYGLAETAAFSLLADLTKLNSNYREIGEPTHTGKAWIVDTNNVEDLVTPGGVGELLLEGPSLGRGYLNDPARTAQNYIPAPSWLMQIRPTAPYGYRCLKTGDLVRYSPNGALEYIRRKDVTEVKIRGQRVDLTDVERHFARQYPTATRVAVDVIIPSDDLGHSGAMLVGFVYTEPPQHGMQSENDEMFASSTTESREKAASVLSALKEVLPTFMVPDVVVTVNRIPATTSGKLHRDRLRRLASALSRRALLAYGNAQLPGTNEHSERLVE